MPATISLAHSPKLTVRFNAIKSLEASEPLEALKGYDELILLAIKEENVEIQTDAQIQSSKINKKLGFYYKALHNSGTALQLITRHLPNDKYRLAIACRELGSIYADGLKKYGIAIDYFFRALKFNEPSLNATLYNNIGSVYSDSKNYKEAIIFLEKGLSFIKKGEQLVSKIFILENLGRIYTIKKEYSKAENFLLTALKISDEVKQGAAYISGYALNSLARLYLETNRVGEAILLIEKALSVAMSKKHLAVIITSLINKGAYGRQIGDDILFLKSVNKAIEYSEGGNLIHEKNDCFEILKGYYWAMEDYKAACIIGNKILNLKAEADKRHESNSMADVLEQREFEIMALEENNRMVNRQKEELKQFAYIVAHDLKEPLRNIGSYSGLIKRRYANIVDKEGEEFLDFVVNNAAHMYKMLEDLLKYATLNGDAKAIEITSPTTILDHLVYRIKDKVSNTGTTIVYRNLPTLPINSMHLSVLLDNLIKNAIKFRSLDRKLFIEITAEEQETHYCFAVKDNGKGISSDYHDTIFQIFKRLDKDKYPGTGIGLSICKKIVETYHGKIWIESEINKGTTFFFTVAKAF